MVRELIEETIFAGNLEDAFYVCNIDDIIAKHQNWLLKMPRVRPFYAVKCNNSQVVLEILSALGIGFDCASKAEIDSILDTGVHPSNIIYANPCKARASVQYADKVGVDLMTFDNEEELLKIHDLFPDARLVLRIKVDDSHAKYHLSKKFGAKLSSIPVLMQTAKNLSLNIVGVSFHVGSGCDSADAYRDAIANAKAAFEIGSQMGFKMNILDIGGGFPGASDAQQKDLFDKIADVVTECLDTHFPVGSDISVIAEPGRYYVQSAFTLTTLIISKRVDVDDDTGDRMIMYYINDGLYGSFSNTTFEEGEAIPLPEIKEQDLVHRTVTASMVWGPTCDSLDFIQKKIFLPEMRVGEWMTFTDMGAYTLSLGTKFNGFSMPIVKCHASISSIDFLMKSPAWSRLLVLMGLDDEAVRKMSKKSLAYQIWDYIHVLE